MIPMNCWLVWFLYSIQAFCNCFGFYLHFFLLLPNTHKYLCISRVHTPDKVAAMAYNNNSIHNFTWTTNTNRLRFMIHNAHKNLQAWYETTAAFLLSFTLFLFTIGCHSIRWLDERMCVPVQMISSAIRIKQWKWDCARYQFVLFSAVFRPSLRGPSRTLNEQMNKKRREREGEGERRRIGNQTHEKHT